MGKERVLYSYVCLCLYVSIVTSVGCEEATYTGLWGWTQNPDSVKVFCLKEDNFTNAIWTLVARTGTDDAERFGWIIDYSDHDRPPYSLGLTQYLSDQVIAYDFLLVGGTNSYLDPASIFSTGTSVYRVTLPSNTSIHLLMNTVMATTATPIWQGYPVQAQCTGAPVMMAYMGYSESQATYWFKDNPSPDRIRGLAPNRWFTFDSGCLSGHTDAQPGSLWARVVTTNGTISPAPSRPSFISPSSSPNLLISSAGSNATVIGLIIAVAILGLVVIAGIIIFVIIFRKKSAGVVKGSATVSLELEPTQRTSTYSVSSISVRDGKSIALLSDVNIKEKIGQGHFGDVYRGMWTKTEVALKAIKKEDTNLHSEATVLQQLNHPNIVRFFGLYVATKGNFTTYMVMEFMKDGSLETFVRSRSDLTCDALIDMSLDAIAGMRYLSEKKIVHRDLALRNLLVKSDNGGYSVKVSDFGLSRFTENIYGSSDATMPIKWASPEVLKYNKYSTKSDIWAMGVTLWELFSMGMVPYNNLPNLEVIEYVLSGKRLSRPKDSPIKVYEVMKTCWNIEPMNRPSWDEMYLALEKLKGGSFNLKSSEISTRPSSAMDDSFYGNNPNSQIFK